MDYWTGYMNWGVDKGWRCETCGQQELAWSLVHGICRCDTCHTQYNMRDTDEKRTILTKPRCLLKEDYKDPVKKMWQELHKTLSDVTDEELDRFMPVKIAETNEV